MELKLRVLGIFMLLVWLTPACSSYSSDLALKSESAIDAEPVLLQAVEQLMGLESASFSLNHIKGSTVLMPGVLMTKISGEVSIPNRSRVTVEAQIQFPKSYVEIDIVRIQETAYMTSIFGGDWNQIPAESLPFNLSGLGLTMAEIVDAIQKPKILGDERLNGIDTLRIGGMINSKDLVKLVPGAEGTVRVDLELWINREDGLLQRALIAGQVVPTDDVDTIRDLVLKNINQPVVIDAPIETIG